MKGKTLQYIKTFAVWFFLAVILGLITGFVGGFFHKLIAYATKIRTENDICIWFLPIAGVIIAALYSLSKERLTTDTVILSIREGKAVSPLMVPLIFIGTVLTHLTGGSAGREGAALQIGGGIGSLTGRCIKADAKTIGILTVAGMAGAFSAIFTTPVTAAVFAIEVVTVGHMRYFQLMPCLVSSVTAFMVSLSLGNERLYYGNVSFPELSLSVLIKVVIAAVIISLASSFFCIILHKTEKMLKSGIKNAYLRAFFGGICIIALTLILNTRMFNGAGTDTIAFMLSGDEAKIKASMTGIMTLAFLIKTVMTAITIGSGFKGGEIVPAFFSGAVLGALLGVIFGADPSFFASIGMIGMFSGITNCPMASIIMGCELFGSEGLIYVALSVGIGFILSGKFGLYEGQRLVYEKYGVDKIK